MHPLTTAIRAAYASAADPKQAPAMQKYMKSSLPYYGIKLPLQRKINRELFKLHPVKSFDEYVVVIRKLWDASYREERYAAIAVAEHFRPFITMEALPTYRMMIETGAWWDLVDGIAAHLIGELLCKHPVEMKIILKEWIKDSDLWIRRSAILAQLRFKTDTDSELLFEFCAKCLQEQSFWIRKAVGWSLRDYSKVAPEKVRAFVEEYRKNMSGVTLREARKYI